LVPCLPAILAFRFLHRIIGGGFNKDAPAEFGARVKEHAIMLIAREWASLMPPTNQSL
jgi:hypothetical protein